MIQFISGVNGELFTLNWINDHFVFLSSRNCDGLTASATLPDFGINIVENTGFLGQVSENGLVYVPKLGFG